MGCNPPAENHCYTCQFTLTFMSPNKSAYPANMIHRFFITMACTSTEFLKEYAILITPGIDSHLSDEKTDVNYESKTIITYLSSLAISTRPR